MSDEIKVIVNALSELIQIALQVREREYVAPSFSPDRSDDTIKFQKERVATLRRIREEFENEMTRQLPPF